MLSRTIIVCRCNNQTTANNLVAGLNNQLINKAVAQVEDNRTPVAIQEDVWTVYANIRFLNQADADAWYQTAATEIGTSKILTGSSVHVHECPHNDAVNTPCVIRLVTSK